MRRIFILLFIFSSALSLNAQDERITILFTNDLHSRLLGYAPESDYSPATINDDKTIGGFARIATIIKTEKQNNNGITFVLDAGDFLMGTLFQSLEPQTGFQLRLMKEMGYDVVCIGNHEFDFGPEKLAEIIGSAAEKEIPQILLGNAVFSKENSSDDQLEKLFNSGTLKPATIIEKGGIKIGLFSLLGKVADENAAFAAPVTFAGQVKTAKSLSSRLTQNGCNLIICLSHSGLGKDEEGNWAGEDVDLAEKVKAIDVIISGHTHTRIDNPLIIRGIPIGQSGEYGNYVGKMVLINNGGNITLENYTLIPVDDKIPGDARITELIEEQKKMVTEKVLKPLGMDYSQVIAENDFLLECNEQGDIKGSNLGPLVADAIHNYINLHSLGGTDVSMVAVGVIRDKFIPGKQTPADIFRIMSMGKGNDNVPGYPLSQVYVTGKELKSILEILQVAYKSTPGNYCYFSGINVDFDPDKGMLKKISSIRIKGMDGSVREVDFSKRNKELYSITANSYMLEFIGIIKKMSFGLINVVPKAKDGSLVTDMKNCVIDCDTERTGIQEGKEWLALIEYLSGMKDVNNNSIPDFDGKYKDAIQTFSVVKR